MSRVLVPDQDFEMATDQNLPKVDDSMIFECFRTNPAFQDPELRNIKTTRATRESYGDNAVGYVQLKRSGGLCTVKAKITPEHKIHKTAYRVEVEINESEEVVISCKCCDCIASKGGCKHAIAFLLWLYRKSSRPSVTETECYWKKSKLSKVGTATKFVKLAELCSKPVPEMPNSQEDFFQEVLSEARKVQSSGNIFLEEFPSDAVSTICIHKNWIKFKDVQGEKNVETFLQFLQLSMTSDVCQMVEEKTSSQYKCPAWYRARYGRITASKLYEASRCKTAGTLVASILGSCQPVMTEAIKRGHRLEKEVLHEVKKAYEIKKLDENCGLYLNEKYPVFGASPDGLSLTHVIEVKCPSKENKMKEYIDEEGNPTSKPYAQIQLQMLMTGRKLAYYCVALPDFEQSRGFYVSEVPFDEDFTLDIMQKAELFWKEFVFPKL